MSDRTTLYQISIDERQCNEKNMFSKLLHINVIDKFLTAFFNEPISKIRRYEWSKICSFVSFISFINVYIHFILRNHIKYCITKTNELKAWQGLLRTFEQGYMLKNWEEGLSDEAFYPWESPKRNRIKSVNPTYINKLKNVLIYQ